MFVISLSHTSDIFLAVKEKITLEANFVVIVVIGLINIAFYILIIFCSCLMCTSFFHTLKTPKVNFVLFMCVSFNLSIQLILIYIQSASLWCCFQEDMLYEGARITASESYTLVLAFAIKYGLAETAVEDLLAILNIHMPMNYISSSSYLFRNIYRPDESSNFKFVCKNCGTLVPENTPTCGDCGSVFDKAANIKSGDFFICLSVEEQLRSILQSPTVLRMHKLSICSDSVSDVSDSLHYRNQELLQDVNNFSVTVNCDGIPVFKSSFCSLWPILITCNELEPVTRRKNVMVAGLWFGKSKPEMATFLQPFVEEMQSLCMTGMSWVHPVTNREIQSKVLMLQCCCDSVARCMMQGLTQFNGQFGCNWCVHEGKVMPKGRGYVRTYPVLDDEPEKRTHLSFVNDAQTALTAGTSCHGVMQASPLLLLNPCGFDIVDSFSVDYMHAVLLGVARQCARFWFDSSFSSEPWYLGRHVAEIDRRLTGICPPSDVRRLPRPVKDRKFWKATEWRAWLLFYSIPVLSDVLPVKYLQHWLILVECICVFLASRITFAEIELCKKRLAFFVKNVEVLYGSEHVSFNMHQLLHLPDTVANFGPLWCSSNFTFEDCNGQLLKFFSGTRYVPQQVARSFLLWRSVQHVRNTNRNAESSCIVDQLLDKLAGRYLHGKNAVVTDSGVALLGLPSVCQLTATELELLEPYVVVCSGEVQVYRRAIINGKPYCTKAYGASLRSNNYTVVVESNLLGEIIKLLLIRDVLGAEHCFAFLQIFRRETLPPFWKHGQTKTVLTFMHKVAETDTVIAVPATDILAKCVAVKVDNALYCCMQPNLVETD